MNTKVLFLCGGGSNLILGTGMENQTFILRTPLENSVGDHTWVIQIHLSG